MHRSFVARYATRPEPRFHAPATGVREPRLGLFRHSLMVPAGQFATVLRRPEGPVTLLRATWRTVAPERSPHASSLGGSLASVRWAKPGARSAGRRARAASAPWRG